MTEWAANYVDDSFDFGPLGVCSGGELLERIRSLRCRKDFVAVDGILYELISQAREGSHCAERVLVQMMIPVAQRMAHRVTTLGDLSRADRVGYAIGCAWEVVREHKMSLHAKIYTNLTHNLLGKLAPRRSANDRDIHDKTATVDGDELTRLGGAAELPAESAEHALARLFTWAVDSAIITSEEVALLSRVALGDETQRQIASELGVSEDCLRKRASRIRARLSSAVVASA